MAVAINPADNTVYVTGGKHTATEQEEFYTVRYKAGGNTFSEPRIWEDHWVEYVGKPSHGVDIALDYSGNAYVTGPLLEYLGSGTNHHGQTGTRRINKEPTSTPLQSDVAWSTLYQTEDGNSPNSLSLSFEFESGVIKTYTYVTGEQNVLGLGTGGRDVFTLRYQWDGDEDWHVPFGAFDKDDYGLHVAAAGRGNAYVTGMRHGGTNTLGDYLLAGYRRANTTRFTPASYSNSGEDEGRWGAIGGAGLLYYTGASAGTSTGFDFATQQHVETASPSNPSGTNGYFVQAGTYTSGGLSDLSSADSNYLIVAAATNAHTPVVFVNFEGTVSTSATELSIHLLGQVTGSGATGVREKVEVYDLLTNAYVMIADHPASVSTDSPVALPLKNDAAQYIDGSGIVKIRVSYYGGTSSSWSAKYNLVRWDIIGT
jgi:hypothetical protein